MYFRCAVAEVAYERTAARSGPLPVVGKERLTIARSRSYDGDVKVDKTGMVARSGQGRDAVGVMADGTRDRFPLQGRQQMSAVSARIQGQVLLKAHIAQEIEPVMTPVAKRVVLILCVPTTVSYRFFRSGA
jgi:hypothetical protein